MVIARASRLLPGLLAACVAATAARASGFTDEGQTQLAANHQHGPIALTADGRWLAHVDAANTLHRTAVADHAVGGSVAFDVPIRALAVSRTAQKVAFAAEDGCLGIVDFGSGPAPAPRVSWRQTVRLPDGRVVADPVAWAPTRPAECDDDGVLAGDADQLVLSLDGRLLATAAEVTDLDARRVVFTRPRSHVAGRADAVLRMRLLERDTRLAVISATLGQADEGVGSPSGLQAAVWDLPTRTLWSVAELADADLVTPQGQFADILPNGVLLWGDGTRRKAAAPGSAALVDLMQWNAAACGQPPAVRAALQPWQWQSLVVDPRGRWIAGMRKVERTGATDELVVAEIATGRTLVQRAFKHEVHGLVAAPDGGTLYGLSARSVRLPSDGGAPEPVGPVSSVGEVIETPVPLAGLAAPAGGAAWSAKPCLAGDEAPDARRVPHTSRVLAPAWTLPLVPDAKPGAGGLADAAGADCSAWCGSLFTMRDGGLWLDRGAHIAALDAASGRVLRTLATPRSARVNSVPLPAADGFVNGQGDTLSWRPFDAGSGGARRVIDVRPGYQVLRMERRGAAVLAVWVRKPGAGTPRDPEGRPVFDAATYVLYDAAGRRLSEMPGSEQCAPEACSAPLRPELLRQLMQPCHDEAGPLASGFDWRPGVFDSVRAFACGPLPGAARLVFWDGVDGTPAAAAPAPDDQGARLVAHDGAIGVVRVGNRLHVFDAGARRELGQVAVARSLEREDVVLDVPPGLLLVVSSEQEGDERRVLRAYRFR